MPSFLPEHRKGEKNQNNKPPRFLQVNKYHSCLETVTHIFANSIFYALCGPLRWSNLLTERKAMEKAQSLYYLQYQDTQS